MSLDGLPLQDASVIALYEFPTTPDEVALASIADFTDSLSSDNGPGIDWMIAYFADSIDSAIRCATG